MKNSISIIIPALNEEENIGKLIKYLLENGSKYTNEIIVADGGSTDNTKHIASDSGAKAVDSHKGRAVQMNTGARNASGDILYFLHADTYPPKDYEDRILNSYGKGYNSGCFRLSFDYKHWFLKTMAWFTRFDINAFRYGDQSLFVSKELFGEIGGFNEKLIAAEDNEIVARLKKQGKFTIMEGCTVTSARKYLDNGIYKLQGVFTIIYIMYKLGYPQEKLIATYKKLIRDNKHV